MTMKNITIGVLVGAIIAGLGFAIFFMATGQFAGASAGQVAAVERNSTTKAVGPQENIEIFTKKAGGCAARVITTKGSYINFTLDDANGGDVASTTVGSTIGHLQAASTTVIYDGATFGCGSVWAYSPASTTITVSETQ